MRLIPSLLIKNQSLIKTKSFKFYKYLGDPVNVTRIYLEKGADELIINDCSAFKTGINFNFLEKIASNSFIPITYAGNIKNIDEIKKLIHIGIERVAIGIYQEKDWDLIIEASSYLGNSGVCSILNIGHNKLLRMKMLYNYKKKRFKYRYNLEKVIEDANAVARGEIILVDCSNDGTREGFSLHKYRNHFKENIPITAYGGVKDYLECQNLWKKNFNGVASSAFLSLLRPHDALLINYPKERLEVLNKDLTPTRVSIDRYSNIN